MNFTPFSSTPQSSLLANVLNPLPPTPPPSAGLPPTKPDEHYSSIELLSHFSSTQVDDILEFDETDSYEIPDLDALAALFQRERYTGPKVYRDARLRKGNLPMDKKPDAEAMDVDVDVDVEVEVDMDVDLDVKFLVEKSRGQRLEGEEEKGRVRRSIKRVRRVCLREKRTQAKQRKKDQEAAGGGDSGERREGGRRRGLLRGPSRQHIWFSTAPANAAMAAAATCAHIHSYSPCD
jgi:hypothetical protein